MLPSEIQNEGKGFLTSNSTLLVSSSQWNSLNLNVFSRNMWKIAFTSSQGKMLEFVKHGQIALIHIVKINYLIKDTFKNSSQVFGENAFIVC